MTDVVVLSLEAWDGVWRRNQHLVAGLLRSDPSLRVLFVEPPADPTHALTLRRPPCPGRGLRSAPAIEGIHPRQLMLLQPTKWLPRRVDAQADDRLAHSVQRAAAELGFESPILWVNDPDGATVLARTGWPALYDITDDWLLADRPEAELERLRVKETLLLDRCLEVVVCSKTLQTTKRPASNHLIQNAVDLDAYRSIAVRPPDLPDSCALYVGTLHPDRLDVGLCLELARSLPQPHRVAFVGPVLLSSSDARRMESAGALLLGAREHQLVPAYLQHANVLIVPHLVNAFTNSLDPIKVYEYMAAGRPIVSTPVAGFRGLDSQVHLAGPAEFADAVLSAMLSGSGEGALPLAVPTWSERVGQFREVLDLVATGKPA